MQKRIGKRRPPLRLPIAQEKGRRLGAELAVVRDRIEGQGHAVWSERESETSRHEGEAPKNLKIGFGREELREAFDRGQKRDDPKDHWRHIENSLLATAHVETVFYLGEGRSGKV